MSLLMQALRKAERAKHGDPQDDDIGYGADSAELAESTASGPAFSLDPPAKLSLEPLDALGSTQQAIPVVAATEAIHDPVPPQARHEALRGAGNERSALDDMPRRNQGASAAVRAPTSTARPRLAVLSGVLILTVAAFAFLYWQGVSGPGPGAKLPRVPMPAQAASPLVLAPPASTEAAATVPGLDPGIAPQPLQPAQPVPQQLDSVHTPPPVIAAQATRPANTVITPSPEALAAISDPAIREEAMRDAAERAARAARDAPLHLAAPAPAPAIPASPPAAMAPAAATDTGNIRVARSQHVLQVQPSVQNGYAALQAGDLVAARQQYDQAMQQDPLNRDAMLGSAAVAQREGNGELAASHYLRLLELDPQDADALAGLSALRPGNAGLSEARLKGVLQRKPESGPVLFALGNLYARQGRWPEAQQYFFRAVDIAPGNPDYAFNLAVGLDRMNQGRLAHSYYQRALVLAQSAPAAFDREAARKRVQDLGMAGP